MPPDEHEPVKVASAIHALALELRRRHLGRSRRPAGLRRRRSSRARSRKRARGFPSCRLEVLIPDFQGDEAALQHRARRRPGRAEPQHRDRAAALPDGAARRPLSARARGARADRATIAPAIPTKSGLMVGLGEEWDEVVETLRGSPIRRVPDRDDRPVPAAVARQPADGSLLHARGVRRAEAHRARRWASATSNRARSSAAPTTRTNRPRRYEAAR